LSQDRSEYQKKYYQDHKKELQAYFRAKYLKERKERLTKARTWYILHKEEILAKLKTKSLAFVGHAHAIWNAIRKYAKAWKLPITPWDEFKLWTIDDATYNELFEAWKESGYLDNFSPVVMRGVKKNGFVTENLKWDTKSKYSWWNEDSTIYKEVEKELNETQKDYNKSDKEWRKKVRAEWRAKLKAKRGEKK